MMMNDVEVIIKFRNVEVLLKEYHEHELIASVFLCVASENVLIYNYLLFICSSLETVLV